MWEISSSIRTANNMPPKASGKAAKKAGKAQKSISKGDKKRKRKRPEPYAIYMYKHIDELLKQIEELLNQRFLRTHHCFPSCPLRQEGDHSPEGCKAYPPWCASQTRRLWGYKCCYQVHLLKVDPISFLLTRLLLEPLIPYEWLIYSTTQVSLY